MSNFKKVSQAEFARMIGCSKAHVTGLKQAGRLVMTDDGKKVLVKASLALIEETKDPNRDDVRKRHQEKKVVLAQPKEDDAVEALNYQKARAKNEHFKALQQEAEYQKLIGKLVDADEVKKAGADMGAHLRSSLENLQDQLSAELAPETDHARVHAVLGEYFERLLRDISATLEKEIGQGRA